MLPPQKPTAFQIQMLIDVSRKMCLTTIETAFLEQTNNPAPCHKQTTKGFGLRATLHERYPTEIRPLLWLLLKISNLFWWANWMPYGSWMKSDNSLIFSKGGCERCATQSWLQTHIGQADFRPLLSEHHLRIGPFRNQEQSLPAATHRSAPECQDSYWAEHSIAFRVFGPTAQFWFTRILSFKNLHALSMICVPALVFNVFLVPGTLCVTMWT